MTTKQLRVLIAAMVYCTAEIASAIRKAENETTIEDADVVALDIIAEADR